MRESGRISIFSRPETGNENSNKAKVLYEYVPAKRHLQIMQQFELKILMTSPAISKLNIKTDFVELTF